MSTPASSTYPSSSPAVSPDPGDDKSSGDLHSGSGGGPTAADVKAAGEKVHPLAGFAAVPPIDDEALAIATAERVSAITLNTPPTVQPGEAGYTRLAPTRSPFPTATPIAHDGRTVTGVDTALVRLADGGIEPILRGEGLPTGIKDGEEARLERIGVFGPHPTKPALA